MNYLIVSVNWEELVLFELLDLSNDEYMTVLKSPHQILLESQAYSKEVKKV